MKNIHVLPTDKSSRLSIKDGILILHRLQWRKGTHHIYITSYEEIKEGDWCICLENIFKNEIFKVDSDTPNKSSNVTLEFAKKYLTKIILTTDQDLIEDGVQAINDEFLEWFVKNPSCEEVEVEINSYMDKNISDSITFTDYKIIIPKEEPKQETLEEVAETFLPHSEIEHDTDFIIGFIAGAKWQQERMYSEQEVLHLLDTLWDRLDRWYNETEDNEFNLRKWFDECELKK